MRDEDADRSIRRLDAEVDVILEVTNSAAEMYYGVIPERCHSRPYMTREDVRGDISGGVEYFGYVLDSETVGVIGIQEMDGFVAVRRLYVVPDHQRKGIGSRLIDYCLSLYPETDVYAVTWKRSDWALDFYEENGFESLGVRPSLIERHWNPPEGCEEEFVVLVFER